MNLPAPVREMGVLCLDRIGRLTELIERLADEFEHASKTDDDLRRLCTMPRIGPVTAGPIAAFAPDLSTFERGRNFAAWLGFEADTSMIVPVLATSGTKEGPSPIARSDP